MHSQPISVWGNCTTDIADDIEGITDLKVEKTWLTEGSPVIMFQMEEQVSLPRSLLICMMKIEIHYKLFMYEFQEVRTVSVLEGPPGSTERGPRMILLFRQKNRLM